LEFRPRGGARVSLSLLPNVPQGRGDRSLARSAWDSATAKESCRRGACRRGGVGGQVQERAITSFPIRGLKWATIQLSVSTRCHRDKAKACLKMSWRDDAIVARHEVPGTAPPQNIRPVGPKQGETPYLQGKVRRDALPTGSKISKKSSAVPALTGAGFQGEWGTGGFSFRWR
jgi:hypothetical protein